MSARINKEVASPEPLVSKNLRFELYEKYHLLSKDPNPITTVRRNLMDARKAGRMGKFRIPICMDLPADYLRSLKTEAILKHQEMFNAVKSTIQPTLADDITVLICDFANPHYYYRLDQICSNVKHTLRKYSNCVTRPSRNIRNGSVQQRERIFLESIH